MATKKNDEKTSTNEAILAMLKYLESRDRESYAPKRIRVRCLSPHECNISTEKDGQGTVYNFKPGEGGRWIPWKDFVACAANYPNTVAGLFVAVDADEADRNAIASEYISILYPEDIDMQRLEAAADEPLNVEYIKSLPRVLRESIIDTIKAREFNGDYADNAANFEALRALEVR